MLVYLVLFCVSSFYVEVNLCMFIICLFISVLLLETNYEEEKGWDPIN